MRGGPDPSSGARRDASGDLTADELEPFPVPTAMSFCRIAASAAEGSGSSSEAGRVRNELVMY